MSVREVLIQAGYEVNTPISESTVQLAELIDDLTSEQKLVVQRIVEMMRDAEKTAQIDIRMLISVGGESTVLPFPLQSDKSK